MKKNCSYTNFKHMRAHHKHTDTQKLHLLATLPGPEVCSTQLSTKFQLLIKTKIPTNDEVYCFKSLRCCIYPANEC